VITLYSWGTPNGNKLHIMLEELGTPYKLIPVNLGKREQHAPEFTQINPNAKIPSIVDTDGPGGAPLTLFESGAILIYLAEKFGRFLPADRGDRYHTIQWIMFQMAGIGPMFGQLHHFTASAESLPYAIRRYRTESERLLRVLDERLARSPYLIGDDYTIADICNSPWIRSWIHTLKNDLEPWHNVQRWYITIETRLAVRKAVEIYNRLRATPT
jgi:GST-like protein